MLNFCFVLVVTFFIAGELAEFFGKIIHKFLL